MLQICKSIFLTNLAIMKKILDLTEFKLGKNSKDYLYMKKSIMDFFYDSMINLFKNLEKENIVELCKCGNKIRHGYSDCSFCNGCGYKNKIK